MKNQNTLHFFWTYYFSKWGGWKTWIQDQRKPTRIWIADNLILLLLSHDFCSLLPECMMIHLNSNQAFNFTDYIALQVPKRWYKGEKINTCSWVSRCHFVWRNSSNVYLLKLIFNWYCKWQRLVHLHCYAAILFLQVDSFHPSFELGFSVCSGKTLIGRNNNFTWVCKWLLGSCHPRFTVDRGGFKWFESTER